MKIPHGMTEEQVLTAIDKSLAILASKYVFGYFDIDDIKQHARMEVIELLAKDVYDPTRPLENFVYTHIENRLRNLRRNKLKRTDPPCRPCHTGQHCCEGGPCAKYAAWHKRNQAKANLVRPLGIDHVSDERERRTRVESKAAEDVQTQELIRRIDEELPVELRASWKQLCDGVKLPKATRDRVEEAVREILGDEICQNGDR